MTTLDEKTIQANVELELINNGKLGQKKFFNMDYEDLKNEFSNNNHNPIYQNCAILVERIEEGLDTWEKLSHELQLMFFANTEYNGMSTRIFFKPEFEEMEKEEIESIINGNFINKGYAIDYYEKWWK